MPTKERLAKQRQKQGGQNAQGSAPHAAAGRKGGQVSGGNRKSAGTASKTGGTPAKGGTATQSRTTQKAATGGGSGLLNMPTIGGRSGTRGQKITPVMYAQLCQHLASLLNYGQQIEVAHAQGNQIQLQETQKLFQASWKQLQPIANKFLAGA